MRNFDAHKPPDNGTKVKVIAIDFDGCLCENAWPGEIGQANIPVIASKGRAGQRREAHTLDVPGGGNAGQGCELVRGAWAGI